MESEKTKFQEQVLDLSAQRQRGTRQKTGKLCSPKKPVLSSRKEKSAPSLFDSTPEPPPGEWNQKRCNKRVSEILNWGKTDKHAREQSGIVSYDS